MLVGVAVALTLALAACGSGDTSTTHSTSSVAPSIVSRQQFVDRSKAVCRKWREKVNKGLKDLYRRRTKETGEGEGSVGTVESMQTVIVPAMRQQLAEMETVGLPKEEAYAAEMFWAAVRRMTHEIEVEGIFAWTRESTIAPIHNLGKPFELQNCVYF